MSNTKSRKVFSFLTIIVMAGVTVFLFKAGMDITYALQEKYFDGIRSIAAIIFGVSGAWLAITYPKALSSAEQARNTDSDHRKRALADASDDAEVLLGFVHTMIVSIIVIAVSLAIPFAKEALTQWPWALAHKGYFRGSLYAILWVLAVVQLSLLLTTLKSTYKALSELRRHLADAEVQSDRDENQNH